MKKSETKFALIKPKLVEEGEVRAWFTLKNQMYGTETHSIPGLNLGLNTAENKELVTKSRLELLSNLDIDQDWVAYADQVHSNRVQFVIEGGIYPSTDGLITKVPGLTLAIQVADCAAILLWDSDSKIIGALHAGWRGAAGNIVPKGIKKMTDQGADPQKIKVFVSPCISLKNFEVGQEVADQFPDEFVDYERFEKPHLDLKGFLNHQMTEAGIPESQIEVREGCTVEDAEKFYSFRREDKQSGRMMALIQIAE